MAGGCAAVFALPVLLPFYRETAGLEFWRLMAGEACSPPSSPPQRSP
ncbi:MAG: hypothetical protein HYU57_04375 [Micavibrio aeruginosavorus]|nr:hypothetical protein [Micavibrio aeruginosavorus]